MNRTAYIIALCLIVCDICLYQYGGLILAAAALIYGIIGEWIAVRKMGGVLCDPGINSFHARLFNCFEEVKSKTQANGKSFDYVRVYLLPDEAINAYCFGYRSIGVNRGTMQLDDKTVESIVAHECGHIYRGDSVLNRVILTHMAGIILMLMISQFALIIFIYGLFLLLCLLGIGRFSYAGVFITSKLGDLAKGLMHGLMFAVHFCVQAVIAAFGRRAEYLADAYSSSLGYGFYLMRYLDRFSPDDSASRSLTAILYNDHPDNGSRISRLIALQKKNQAVIPGS